MKITTIDYWATSKDSFLHRLAPPLKALGLVCVITAVVLLWNPVALGCIFLALILIAVAAKLPLKLVLTLSAYPLIFTVLLALTTELGSSASISIMLKGTTAACACILLTLTTPYPVIFSMTRHILPRLANDALLLTYRTLFILGDELSNLMRAIRLRGVLGWRHPLEALQTLASALGNLMLFSVSLAEADYDILYMRGYDGHIVVGETPSSDARSTTASGNRKEE